jgi:hypothetical protein
MCIARQHIFVSEDRCGNRIPFGVINLHDGLGCLTQELRVVELVATELAAIENETAIS